MRVGDLVVRARHHARRPIGRTPYVWDLAMWARPEKRLTLARRDTAIVMEGFPRSGNTFSAAAFMVANGHSEHLGRHLHGPAHILRAARLGVPAVVLIRPPRDAVLSFLIRRGTLTPHDAVLEYLDFYRAVWPARRSFVVGRFDQVTSDFGALIEQVNQRFGTSFARYEPTPENEREAFRLVEEMNRRECRGEVVETHVGRPSEQRERRKEDLRGLLDDPRTAAHLATAQRLYEDYAAISG